LFGEGLGWKSAVGLKTSNELSDSLLGGILRLVIYVMLTLLYFTMMRLIKVRLSDTVLVSYLFATVPMSPTPMPPILGGIS